jgi:hypothetical protein
VCSLVVSHIQFCSVEFVCAFWRNVFVYLSISQCVWHVYLILYHFYMLFSFSVASIQAFSVI